MRKTWLRTIAAGLVQLAVSVLLITGLSFALLSFGLGDPIAALYGDRIDLVGEAEAAVLREMYGLDRPLIGQYFAWLGALCTGDFGISYWEGRPVGEILGERIGATLVLTVPALVLGYLLAIAAGTKMAELTGTRTERMMHAVLFLFWSVPSFLGGILLLAVFAAGLGWLPAGGLAPLGMGFSLPTSLPYLVLPLGLLTLYQAARLTGIVASQMRSELASEYIRTARAAGLSRMTVRYYALRSALLPLITTAAMALPRLFAGAVMIETIFSWPGMGRLLLTAAYQRDYPVLMASVVVVSLLTVGGSLLADLLYRLADPRIRRGRRDIR